MKKILISVLIIVVFSFLTEGCAPGGSNYDSSRPIKAIPVTVESSDGNRYSCEGIISLTYGGYEVGDVFDCHKVEK